jgi:hypothetical protein
MSETEEPKTKDLWDKLKILGVLFSSIAIPVVVALAGYWVNVSLKEKDVRLSMVKVAIEILKEDPTAKPETPSLRDWAIDVVDQYSGVPLSKSARNDLKKTPLPSTATTAPFGGIWPFSPPIRYGQISIDSVPKGAKIYIDEEFLGYTNAQFTVPEGSHRIRVQRGQDVQKFSVYIHAHEVLVISASFEK